MNTKLSGNEIQKVIENWHEKNIPELIAELQKLLSDKNAEIDRLQREVAEFSIIDPSYKTVKVSGSWEELFLLFTTKKQVLYDFLYEKLTVHEKSNLYGSILNKYEYVPQLGKNALLIRKRQGFLSPEQVEVFDAICRFSTYISDNKKDRS